MVLKGLRRWMVRMVSWVRWVHKEIGCHWVLKVLKHWMGRMGI